MPPRGARCHGLSNLRSRASRAQRNFLMILDGDNLRAIEMVPGTSAADPLLQRDFPLVELADIKWFQPNMHAQPTAIFTVICLPKDKAPAPPGEKAQSKSSEN